MIEIRYTAKNRLDVEVTCFVHGNRLDIVKHSTSMDTAYIAVRPCHHCMLEARLGNKSDVK